VDVTNAGAVAHWDEAYRLGNTSRSWFQQKPVPSVAMLDAAGISRGQSVIDVGGGGSTLVDALLERGHTDLTVLDISAEGLRTARHRVGEMSGRVQWVRADLRTWVPKRTWDVWHDRALLHFFVADHDRQRYLHALDAATEVGSIAILATFAADGPQQCSGLPVNRYAASDLATLLGTAWQPLTERREEHHTPAGGSQPFTWVAFRRLP
jgi:SAM-dependent methyltransferase